MASGCTCLGVQVCAAPVDAIVAATNSLLISVWWLDCDVKDSGLCRFSHTAVCSWLSTS